MAWTVEIASSAAKQISRLDRPAQARVMRFLREKLAVEEDPRRLGKPLRGEKAELWRYRVGDYRVICQIHDERLVVLVLRVGHRKDVYR
ncbi:MAG: type II toxin-antitoxin system RelE family toxin [Terriglobales bacterium]